MNTNNEKNPFIITKDLTKKYGAVTVLDRVNFSIFPGEVRGLIGENGSGKSTLASIISGINQLSSGEMLVQGKKYDPASAIDAAKSGIYMIVQESGIIPNITVAQNIFLGEEKDFSRLGVVNRKKMLASAQQVIDRLGIKGIKAMDNVTKLSFEKRKMVEVAKALRHEVNLFIVDETTTALSEGGREFIHEVVRDIRDSGKSVLFISHDLEELMSVSDNITVLRDGKLVLNLAKNQFNADTIKNTMVGRKIEGNYYRTDYGEVSKGPVTLRAINISNDYLKNVSLELHSGEILGVGGLSGSGMHDIGKVLFGLEKVKTGKVEVKVPVVKKGIRTEEFTKIKNNIQAKKLGIGYVPKDRDQEAVIGPESIKDNLALSNLDSLSKYGIITYQAVKRFASQLSKEFSIRCSSINQPIYQLSGGNKQKVSFAKWIGSGSKILIFDSPTRGIDVGVKTTIYQLLYKLRNYGYSILIISEELTELLGMADRILLVRDGTISHAFSRSPTLGENDLIQFMI
jgi:ribose transport system ATP-binding protein